MADMVICGSCYVYVEKTGTNCPRCHDPLVPSKLFHLRRFAEQGINPSYRGVPLPVSQEAAAWAVSTIEGFQRFIEFVRDTSNDERLRALAKEELKDDS